MGFTERYPTHPSELIVSVFVSNPFDEQAGSFSDAIIDTGASFSFIEKAFATDELQVVPVMTEEIVTQPIFGSPATEPPEQPAEVVRVIVSVGSGREAIQKEIKPALCQSADPREGIRVILGMDFLNTLDIMYCSGARGATFAMFDTP